MRDLQAERDYSVEIDPLETLKIRYAMVLRDNKKLQAEVERLQINLVDYQRGAVSMTKQIQGLRAENALLRKVVKAANDGNTFALVQALAELDREDER
jgi:stress response protein YsnF